MNFDHGRQERFVEQLRRSLPLSAHASPALLAFLRALGAIGRGSPRLMVINVFDAGEGRSLMCRFTVVGEGAGRGFVAPLAQLALDRRRTVGSDAALCQRPVTTPKRSADRSARYIRAR
jgi:hypothetical protein